MKSILPILACLVWTGWGLEIRAQTPAPQGPPPTVRPGGVAASADSNPGDGLLRRVMATVDSQRSIAAKVRHKVDLLGRTMFGSGIYLQQGRGPDRLLRLELKLQNGDRASTVLEVCDGTALWIFADFGEGKSLGRVDMGRLRRARPKSPAPPAFNAWFAAGGLPKLLANLDSSFRFGPVVDNRLDDVRVWTLEGQWESGRLAQLLPDQKPVIDAGGVVDLTKLAPNLPDRVTLHIGCDDLFPYRVEYWRAAPPAKDAKTNDHGKLLVVMELYEVQLGAPIDPRQFTLAPGDLQPIDRTQAFLDKLSLEETGAGEAVQPLPPRR